MKFEQNMNQQQKQVQKLAMTQQLQQSIQMLQFNTEDLRTFLENKALENPLIEVDTKVESDYGDFHSDKVQTNQYDNNSEKNYINQIPDEHISLFESLLEQIHLNYRDTYLRKLLLFLTEFVDVNGYLAITLEEAQSKTGAEPIQLLDALTLLQQLDPPGVGARNLQECLMLQTERDDQAPELAYVVLEEDFADFVERKWQVIAQKYGVTLADIQKISDYVQLLSPAPGAIFNEINEQYIMPDLVIQVADGSLQVLSTKSGMPTIQFQEKYFARMSEVADREVEKYLKEKKAEFEWIARSLSQRGDTILKVGTEIVKRQANFFLEPDHPLVPLTLREVAETLGIHESTVSRTVNGKYLQTSFGVFELRSFFTTGLNRQASDGTKEDISTSLAKKKLAALIAAEDKAKPLSDQKLVDALTAEGISISRRTVAKYRDELGILSSAKRKRYDL